MSEILKSSKKQDNGKAKDKAIGAADNKKYVDCVITCVSCGCKLYTQSIMPEIKTEVCSNCHPFYNGVIVSKTIGKAKQFIEKLQRNKK
ncbi:MAG: 50S ribosomal protein L31 [Bacilli bacterium]|nr:50S ribosomal protein L31 [Bacilli bacterium]